MDPLLGNPFTLIKNKVYKHQHSLIIINLLRIENAMPRKIDEDETSYVCILCDEDPCVCQKQLAYSE
jgi:hypothetical protein